VSNFVSGRRTWRIFAADSVPLLSLELLASLARLAAERPTVRRRKEDYGSRYDCSLSLALFGVATPQNIIWTRPGEISAVVIQRDQSPLPGVTVTLSSVGAGRSERNRTQVTGMDGKIRFKDLEPGQYLLNFQLSGFADTAIGPVALRSRAQENPRLPEFLVMLNPIMWVD
jgi:hypothetical protein